MSSAANLSKLNIDFIHNEPLYLTTVNSRSLLLKACLILLIVPSTFNVHAQEPAIEPAASPAETKLQQARDQLQQIQKTLVEKRLQLEQMRVQLGKLADPVERAELQNRISQGEADMSTLRRSFENIALGGVDSSVFDPARQKLQFDWQQELQLILEPIFQKMRELTDKPRQIEQLKNQLVVLESKLRVVNRALTNLEQLRSDNIPTATRKLMDAIYTAWTQQLNDIQREQDITRLRLNVLQDSSDSIFNRIRQSTSDFISGSGRNLLLSLLAFVITFLTMKGMYYLFNRIGRRNAIRVSTGKRIMTYGYQALTILSSIMAAMMVLYLLGDMMLIVFTVIVLVMAILGLRNYVPRFIVETRLLLDIGPIRKHERVIYQGIPWEVRSLGVHSYLHNPALEGLLRLPVTEMTGLVSRPYHEDEPWFPTQVGDWVMFADGSMGLVLRQTPDTVQIKTKGSIKYYQTASFLQENMRNLSQGFGVSINFGIDYQHQSIATTTIPAILKQSVEQALQKSDLASHVENIQVEFQEAASSSLNYLVDVGMKGSAASSYYAIGRLLQQTCVNCCNANGWIIPFNQITLNAGTGLDVTNLPITPKK